jgi:quercetin dioxygenase-like cupin family protein
MPAHPIEKFPIHLGRNATAIVEPEFTGTMEWYAAYGARHQEDGMEGRIVSMFTFDKPWESWEMHPSGSEVVLCTAGRITLHQEHADGTRSSVVLEPGEYAINPPGTWHTADISGAASAVFITAGMGTQNRPRAA